MLVYLPGRKAWLGPYTYELSQEKVVEVVLCGGVIELEDKEEQKALQLLKELEEPFRSEFKKIVDAFLIAKEFLNSVSS
jgi:hypothetical protein